jgi:RNA polymerase sigma-70 factor (ECF subfamily)
LSKEISYKKFKQGKQKAFTQIYDAYAPAMYHICMRYAHCNDDAQEMLQEGFIRIYEKRELYDEARSFPAWVKRIMINSSINYLRKNKRMMFVDDDTVFDSSEEINFEVEITSSTSEKIKIAIQNLSPGYRTVFNMYVMDNLTHNEIAEFLNISVNTSKSQLRKARILLKEALEKEGITQYAEIDE